MQHIDVFARIRSPVGVATSRASRGIRNEHPTSITRGASRRGGFGEAGIAAHVERMRERSSAHEKRSFYGTCPRALGWSVMQAAPHLADARDLSEVVAERAHVRFDDLLD
jgi:hypothetical protein